MNMKIVFVVIPMSQEPSAAFFNPVENPELTYKGKVRFAINSVLADKMKKDEEVRVVRFINTYKEEYEKNDSLKYAEMYADELNEINKKIGAHITYCDILEDFNESRSVHKERFLKSIRFLEKDAELYADITMGQKTMIPLVFSALTFGERFFNADIQYIVYGQIKFIPNPKYVDQETTPEERPKIKDLEHAQLHDITTLFYLNNMAIAMEAPDGKTAVNLVERFFSK